MRIDDDAEAFSVGRVHESFAQIPRVRCLAAARPARGAGTGTD
jgi:hypothetical protein